MSLTKLQVKDNNEQTVYVTYSIDELSSITKWTGAGKTLLEEISLEFNNINAQSKSLFDKQIEIAAHYQDQLKQTEDKLAQTEAKIAEIESKLDSCDGQLIDKTQALEAKEKELQTKQAEYDKLLTAYNYNDNSDNNLLEETTHSYESKLKALKENLYQKTNQIQLIQEKLEKAEATKNETKQLAAKLVDSLESANNTIKQLQNQSKNQPNRDIIDIEHDELSDLKKRINLLEKIQQNPNPNSTSDRGLLSRQSSVTTESLKTKDNTEEKGIKIEMKTSLPYFTGRSDSMNVGDWLFQSKK
jgi:chromosome segregation ATPase